MTAPNTPIIPHYNYIKLREGVKRKCEYFFDSDKKILRLGELCAVQDPPSKSPQKSHPSLLRFKGLPSHVFNRGG